MGQKYKHFLSFTAILLGIMCSTVVFAAPDMTWLDGLASEMEKILKLLFFLLIPLSFLYFTWGMVVFIANVDNEVQRTAGKKKMLWGVIALFVILSFWGIVELLRVIFGVVDVLPSKPTTS